MTNAAKRIFLVFCLALLTCTPLPGMPVPSRGCPETGTSYHGNGETDVETFAEGLAYIGAMLLLIGGDMLEDSNDSNDVGGKIITGIGGIMILAIVISVIVVEVE